MDSTRYLRVLILAFIYSLFCLQAISPQSPLKEDDSKDGLNSEGEETWDSEKYNEEADQTHNLVFHKYNPRIRPPDLYVLVDLAVTLTHVRYLDVAKQELQTVLDLEMVWLDSRLRWFPYKVKEIHESTDHVWSPAVVYLNSVAPVQDLYPNIVKIVHNGSISWMRKQLVTTRCPTDPSSRDQSCPITIGFVTNDREENDHFIFFFSDLSSVGAAADVDAFSHAWRLKNLELNLGNENETKASTFDLDLVLESKNAMVETDDTESSSRRTTDNYVVENGPSGQTGGCGCNGGDTAHIRDLVLTSSCILGVWLVGFLKGQGSGLAR